MATQANFQVKMQKIAGVIQSNKYVSSITNGLMAAMPITIIGALGSLINGLPIEPYQAFLRDTGLKAITAIPNEITTNLLALYVAFLVASKFAETYDIDGIPAGILSLMSFLIVTPYSFDTEIATYAIQGIPSNWLGGSGIFTAFIVSLITAKIYTTFTTKGWVISMPPGVPPTVAKSFSGLVPGFVVAILWLAVRFVTTLTPMGDIHTVIFSLIATPLTSLGGTFAAMLIAIILAHVLWVVGVHGAMVVFSVFTPIWTPLTNANLAAYNVGAEIPNIISGALVMQVLFMGSGATLGLVFWMMRAKSEQYRVLGKLAIVPNICGINEPIIFGLPIIMNFTLAIPFIVTPAIMVTLAYIGMRTGILPYLPGLSAPLGTPAILSGLLAGGWKWAIFQALMIVLSAATYYPFFKTVDAQAYQKELEAKKITEDETAKNITVAVEA
ncbi:PTS sugar transporter subunit IIC [Enterococcus sp. LJL99]